MNRWFPGRGTKEHLECTLTFSEYCKAEEELAENPPPEFFLAAYFRGNHWWEPPVTRSAAVAIEAQPEPISKEAFAAQWEQAMGADGDA